MQDDKKGQNRGKSTQGGSLVSREIGGGGYLNQNCWLAKNLGYAPYKRCQYCEFRFRNCLFLQYQVISIVLVLLSFALFILVEKKLPWLVIMVVFTLVIVYGYFFNSSTEKIIKANFSIKRAKDALKELTDSLEEKVTEQTSDIRGKNEHLEELLGMKLDFLRVVNHQLNTPLSIMRNAYAMLKEKSLSSEQALEYLGSGLETMSNTIQDFWDAFELEGQEMETNPTAVDIEKIIKDQISGKQILKITQDRKIKLVYQKPAFKVPNVFCDPKKIIHVVSNLLNNAIFYTPEGSVTVSFNKIKQGGEDYLKIMVTDTGVGITPGDKERMFHKFSRGASSANLHPDGSGLGLYIAQKIMKGNGGGLKLENTKVGKGTTFSFTLPIFSGKVKVKQEDGKENVMVKTKNSDIGKSRVKQRPKLLLVEDQRLLVEMYNSYFKTHDFDFYSASDVKTALAEVKKVLPDVVLLDIILPQKMEDGSVYTIAEQGWDFLAAVKKDPATAKIPVIIFTNLNTDQDRAKAKKFGATAYVFKGNTEPKDLIKVINSSIDISCDTVIG